MEEQRRRWQLERITQAPLRPMHQPMDDFKITKGRAYSRTQRIRVNSYLTHTRMNPIEIFHQNESDEIMSDMNQMDSKTLNVSAIRLICNFKRERVIEFALKRSNYC